MDKRKQLIEQINIVINKLREEPFYGENSGILQLLYKRYKDALEILARDYQNPLLEEMHKAENLLREYSKGV